MRSTSEHPDNNARLLLPSLVVASFFKFMKNRAQVQLRVLRRHPSLWAVPLLLFCVLVALEVTGMHHFKQQLESARQVKAVSLADSAAAAFQLQIQASFKPIYAARALAMQTPMWPSFSAAFHAFMGNVVPKDDDGHYLRILLVAMPNGYAALGWPALDPLFAGTDTLNPSFVKIYNPETVENYDFVKNRVSNVLFETATFAFGMSLPVFIQNVSATESFGYPKPRNPACSVCYNNETQEALWGFLTVAVPLTSLLANKLMHLEAFDRYALLAPRTMVMGESVPLGFTPYPRIEVDNVSCIILASSPKFPNLSKAFKRTAKLTENYDWWILVEEDTDVSVLTAPVLTALIVSSFILACLLSATMVSRRSHQLLLESLVPDAVIKQVRDQAGFLEGSKPILTAGSPANLMLNVAADVAAGVMPSVSDTLTIHTAILQNWDLYTPINLGKQLQQGPLDEDVAAALMQQLLGDKQSQIPTGEAKAAPVVFVSHTQDGVGGMDAVWQKESFASLQSALLVIMIKGTAEGMSHSASLVSEHSSPPPPRPLLETAERALGAAASSWEFDAFELAEATNDRPLSTLGFYLIHTQGLVKTFKLDATALARYLCQIEAGYQSENPYHNSIHAANVLQTMNMILTKGGTELSGFVNPLIKLSAYLAAITHDYEHGGLTNDFLINTRDELAFRYNDKSPLENHHIAAAWLLLKNPDTNFMPLVEPEQYTSIRKMVVEMVLATDMKQHFAIVTHFTATTGNKPPATKSEATKKIVPLKDSEQFAHAVPEAERLVVLQMALKCSDLGHTTAPLQLHKRWLACLEEEFFRQGDQEAARNLPISPLFDRSKPGASKSQVGFYNVVVLPMFRAFCTAFPATSPLMEGAHANFQHWQNVQNSATGA